jgi:predicted membrane channel-forming protein YqfA (hemolysin III family)
MTLTKAALSLFNMTLLSGAYWGTFVAFKDDDIPDTNWMFATRLVQTSLVLFCLSLPLSIRQRNDMDSFQFFCTSFTALLSLSIFITVGNVLLFQAEAETRDSRAYQQILSVFKAVPKVITGAIFGHEFWMNSHEAFHAFVQNDVVRVE